MAVGHFLTAKKNKDDEYYTLYEDVEKDMEWYREYFSGKTVYCPCDDYRTSAFVRYFKRNFHILHLKALLASNYNTGSGAYKYKYDGTFEIVYPTPTGDFNSQEIEPMLTHCDIIVTNPPFSKLRAFFERIMPYHKDVLVMAPLPSVTYPTIRRYIKDGVLKFDRKRPMNFDSPEGIKRMHNPIYLTTLEPRKYTLELKEIYSPEKYPKYDNYDAINVDRSKDIPIDYEGPMGVPISFLKWYDPREWELLDCIVPYVEDRKLFRRLIIKRRR